MRFVPAKTLDQQAVMTVHRMRQGWIEERTALINRLRGLLAGSAGIAERLAEPGKPLPPYASVVAQPRTSWMGEHYLDATG